MNTKPIADPDVQELFSLFDSKRKAFPKRNIWQNSPLAWLKRLPPATIGATGEAVVQSWCEKMGYDVASPSDREADLVIEGLRFEIKTSTLWQAGYYKFQQLRDQNYEGVICLGVSPFDAHCWVVPKDVVMLEWMLGGIKGQHADGEDTAWFSVNPAAPPLWLRGWGGTLREAEFQLDEFCAAGDVNRREEVAKLMEEIRRLAEE